MLGLVKLNTLFLLVRTAKIHPVRGFASKVLRGPLNNPSFSPQSGEMFIEKSLLSLSIRLEQNAKRFAQAEASSR